MKTRPAVVVAVLFASMLCAQEIGFGERYVLAEDRRIPLQELVPGTEEHYAWSILDLQNQGKLPEAEALLAQFAERYPQSGRREVLFNRQRLLSYAQDGAGTLAHLTRILNLHFDHQREVLPEEQQLPSRLPPEAVNRATLTAVAFQDAGLNGFETESEEVLDYLLGLDLPPDRQRELLGRLAWPDSGKLVPMVLADLKRPDSGGFGSLAAHRLLLVTQLDQCAEAMPELLGNDAFVQAYLAKLQPPVTSDWENVPAEQTAYLERLWAFARRLPAAQNSVKAHVLFHRLSFDRSQGTYDKARFLEYAQLPRQVPYVSRTYLRTFEAAQGQYANLGADYRAATRLPPVAADEPLVRDCLAHFLRAADSPAEFAAWFEEGYLKEVFAETKLLNGVGNAETWFGMLDPGRVKALRDRVEVDFLPDNPQLFTPQETVRLRLALKNVPQVLVKTYEINTANWYLQKLEEVTAAVDLDGLAPAEERALPYTQAPILRHTESFEFPAMDRPGVWVVEFIGNGKSSRVLVRKGRLRLAERVGSAGHVFRVYDQDDRPVADAVMHLGARAHSADTNGEIAVPFSTAPGEAKVVVRQGAFAALHSFQHRAEEYVLEARFHLDPESLQAGNRARILARTALTLHGVAVDPGLFEQVTATVRTTDAQGVSSSRPAVGVKLASAKDYEIEFVVPADLRSVEVSLTGKVEQISTGKKIDLRAGQTFPCNGTEPSEAPGLLWLRRAADGCWLELIGRGGEPMVRTPVTIRLKPRWFRRPVDAVLATDERGRIALGDLAEIGAVHAECPLAANAIDVPLAPLQRRSAFPTEAYLASGEALVLPMEGSTAPDTAISLVALSGTDDLAQTVAAEVSLRDGLASLVGVAPGEYLARLLPSCRRVRVHVLPGKRTESTVLARERAVTALPYQPLSIAECTLDGEALALRVVGAEAETRVHVVLSRLLAGPDPADALLTGLPLAAETHVDPQEPARYVSGRTLGDELRYVLERRYAAAFPGVMLQRPSLLLNPWETRRTETEKQQARQGEDWADAKEAKKAAGVARLANGTADRLAEQVAEAPTGPAAPAIEVLSGPSAVRYNLALDAEGRLTTTLPVPGPRQVVTIMVTNGRESVLRQLLLPSPAETYRDLRLAKALDAGTRFGELRTVVALPTAQEVTIENASAARIQSYGSVADVYALFESLTANPELAEFRFILDWADLPEEKKQEQYSRYACHELNVLLSRKDPEFFGRVIRPYVASRRDKTVVDCWLLGAGLEPFLEPWQWARLNAFERAALAKVLPAHAAAVSRSLAEACALMPRDPQAELELFLKALQGRGIAGGFEGPALAVAASGGAGGAVMLGAVVADAAAAPAAAPAPPPAPAAAGKPARALAEKDKASEEAESRAARGEPAGEALRKNAVADRLKRREVRRLYVAQDKTSEWAETSYWKVPLGAQTPDRVPDGRFWADWAAHDGRGPFLSTHVAEATNSFTEMMLVMAVLDLPWKATPGEPVVEQGTLRLKTPGPTVCYRRELKAQEPAAGQEVFVRQEFTDPNAEPERTPYGERPRRIGELVPASRALKCGVMVTNATADPRYVDVLLQVPEGAVPLCDALRLRSLPVLLDPYQQQSLTYEFYFPRPGTFRHYPATVAADGRVLAQAEARSFTVSEKPQTDTGTWDYVSQFGTDDQVLAFLAERNLREVQPRLERIAFRMHDQTFFGKALALLRAQHVFEPVLWSYAVRHNDVPALREYLPHTAVAEACGPWLESPLLSVDVLRRNTYEHKEYWPLVNARSHVLGARRAILNAVFLAQYQALLDRLAHKPSLDAEDRLALTVYLALQDRIEEALAQFARVSLEAVAERVQIDAAQAYLFFCQGKWSEARAIARRYEAYPVKRWRERFGEVLAQCAEIAGDEAQVVDRENRMQVQTQLADTEPTLELAIEGHRILVRHRNLSELTISYYPMDVELLFSRAPFAQDVSAAFAVVRPSRSDRQATEAKGAELVLDLPADYANRNVVIEAVGGGLQRAQAYTPHSLNLQLQENYGQLRALSADGNQPLAKVYVKVYARYQDGRVEFYKDGYTDLRGRFDYTSLSTDDLAQVQRFAVLVLSPDAGALVREVAPPKR